MKHIVALVGCLLTGVVVLFPNVTASAATACTNSSLTGTIAGSVTVSSPNHCTLNGVTITGNLTMTGGELDINGAIIKGSLTVTGTDSGTYNQLCGLVTGGSVTVSGVKDGGGGAFVIDGAPFCAETKIAGAVKFFNNFGAMELTSTKVSGAVTATNNKKSTTFGYSVDIDANKISGSLSCSGNDAPVTAVYGPNTVAGSKSGQCSATAGF